MQFINVLLFWRLCCQAGCGEPSTKSAAAQLYAVGGRLAQKKSRPTGGIFRFRLLLFLHFGIALAAIYRAVFSGTERNFRFGTAGSACGCEHLAVGASAVLAGIATNLASLRLIHETSFSIEFLFTGGESKFRSTFFAVERFVLVHSFNLALNDLPVDPKMPRVRKLRLSRQGYFYSQRWLVAGE